MHPLEEDDSLRFIEIYHYSGLCSMKKQFKMGFYAAIGVWWLYRSRDFFEQKSFDLISAFE